MQIANRKEITQKREEIIQKRVSFYNFSFEGSWGNFSSFLMKTDIMQYPNTPIESNSLRRHFHSPAKAPPTEQILGKLCHKL